MNISIGIAAHNEEGNIGRLLESLLSQELPPYATIKQIIVVASGCTDHTVDIVMEFQRRENFIKLIVEEERQGHASAINKIFANADGDIVVIICADTIPTSKAVFHLIEPLMKDKSIGAVVGKALPVNDPRTFWGYVAHLAYTWLYLPKVLMVDFEGMSAIRRDLFKPIPLGFVNTEHFIDNTIRKNGYKIVHASNSITYTKQPDNLRDFINQRKRNIFGHLQQKRLGISSPHIEIHIALPLIFKSLSLNPKKILWIFIMMVLWGASYFLAWLDFSRNKSYTKWEPITSGKKLNFEDELCH